MSRLNKRALYKMASNNEKSSTNTPSQFTPVSNGSARSRLNSQSVVPELTLDMVQLHPVSHGGISQQPDGRLTAGIIHPLNRDLNSNDAASVSLRARRSGRSAKTQQVDRSTVLNRLGHSSLGHLTNAYLEQQVMTDEEIHMIQEKFYGLQAI